MIKGLVLIKLIVCHNTHSHILLLLIVSRYSVLEQTISKRDSSTPQKSALRHYHHKQVRELFYPSSNFLNRFLKSRSHWNMFCFVTASHCLMFILFFFNLQDVCFWRMGSFGDG